MSSHPPDRPQGPNPFSVPAPGALDDEALGGKIEIYRALLARLDPDGRSVLRPRDQVAAALEALEAERERRQAT